MNFTKSLYFLSTLLGFSLSAFSGEDSGGGAYHKQALRAFESMSPNEAWQSNRFNKKTSNIRIPGTSSFFKPTSLCISGNSISTKSPVAGVCTEWSYRNSEGERKTTTISATARRFEGECISRGASKVLSHPIHYSVEVKTWGARDESGKIRVYRNRQEARENGTPVVVSTRTVDRRLPSTFTTDFYRATAQNKFHRSKYLGNHRYRLNSCR